MRRRELIAVPLAALVGAGAWLAHRAWAGPAGEWLAVSRGELVREVEIRGSLEAAVTSALGPPQVRGMWEYKVTFLAPEGEDVEEGAPVVGFDASELEQQLQKLRNEAEEAAAELEKTSATFARQQQDLGLELAEGRAEVRRQLLASGLPVELEAAIERRQKTLALQLAEARVAHVEAKIRHEEARGAAEMAALAERRGRARARVAELERAIERLTVRSPRRGTVVYSSRRGRDDKVKLGDSVWQGRTVLEIPDLAEMQGAGEVDEADSGQLAAGQPVRLSLDSRPGEEHRGRIQEIGQAVTRSADGGPGKVVPAIVRLDATDPQRMRPGMRFRGRVEVERFPGLLLLPADAVRLTPEGPRVRRRTWLGSEEVAVELGREGGSQVEVVAGLREGERVLRAAAEEGPP